MSTSKRAYPGKVPFFLLVVICYLAVFLNGQFVRFDFVLLRVVKFDLCFLNCPDV